MTEQSQTAPQRHVLIVEDNDELAQLYQNVLETFDYRVTTAGDGEQALKFILESDVDAILCDLTMPRLNGDEFYEAARRARPEVGRRIIFMTGHLNNPRFQPFLEREKLRVLYKPVLVDNLLAELKALFKETSGT